MQHFETLGVNLISESIYVKGECGIKKPIAAAVVGVAFGLLVLFSCFWYFVSAMVAVGSHCASA